MTDGKKDDPWAREVEGVTPLKKVTRAKNPLPRPEKHIRRPSPAYLSLGPEAPQHQVPFDPGLYEKIATGKTPLEAKLDLHGRTEADAHARLMAMIERAWHEDRRRLLVITGKGREGGSPLRAALPKWLSASNLRPYVSSYQYAGQRHGGDGAFYVLLRKKP